MAHAINKTEHNKAAHIHEPRIQISKRSSMIWYKSWAIRAIAILLALVVCGFVIVLLTGYNPLEVYRTMFLGNFGSDRKIWILSIT